MPIPSRLRLRASEGADEAPVPVAGASFLSRRNLVRPSPRAYGAKLESDWNQTVRPKNFFGMVIRFV
jgi:hypothetical protein